MEQWKTVPGLSFIIYNSCLIIAKQNIVLYAFQEGGVYWTADKIYNWYMLNL